MKLIKFPLVFLFFTLFQTLYAQENSLECPVTANDLPEIGEVLSFSVDPSQLDAFDVKVFKIHYWQVNDPNGNSPKPLTETKVLESVALLNRTYNPFNIFFKYTGYSAFDSPNDVKAKHYALVNGQRVCQGLFNADGSPMIDPEGYGNTHKCQISELVNFASNNGYEMEDALNVYVPYATSGGFGGTAGVLRSYSVIPTDNLRRVTMPHEIAHNFGVLHTRSLLENVTRDISNGDYNAHEEGDKVIDTNANNGFARCDANGNNCYPDIDLVNCEYIGTELDLTLTPYSDEIDNLDIINAMSNAYPCIEENFVTTGIGYFTTGQKIRAHELIETDPTGELQVALTSVDVLYEPYKGDYSANATLGPNFEPTFQPGFDYEFVSCGPYGSYPPPLDYSDTSFWFVNGGLFNYIFNKDIPTTDYGTIIHKNNFSIRIAQLDNIQPRNCYSTTGTASSGLLMKFEDNTFNNNVTITAKDSLQINNPNLINDLPDGLYKIEKNHQDGGVEETVIYKGNN